MSQITKTHTVKVTGVSQELLRLLDGRVRERHATGRAEYIRELIRKDVLDGKELSFREILAPVHDHTRIQSYGEEEIDAVLDRARNESFAERHPQNPSAASQS